MELENCQGSALVLCCGVDFAGQLDSMQQPSEGGVPQLPMQCMQQLPADLPANGQRCRQQPRGSPIEECPGEVVHSILLGCDGACHSLCIEMVSHLQHCKLAVLTPPVSACQSIKLQSCTAAKPAAQPGIRPEAADASYEQVPLDRPGKCTAKPKASLVTSQVCLGFAKEFPA